MWMLAQLTAVLANLHPDEEQHVAVYRSGYGQFNTPDDFMPPLERMMAQGDDSEENMTDEDAEVAISFMLSTFGGVDKRGDTPRVVPRSSE